MPIDGRFIYLLVLFCKVILSRCLIVIYFDHIEEDFAHYHWLVSEMFGQVARREFLGVDRQASERYPSRIPNEKLDSMRLAMPKGHKKRTVSRF